MASWLDDIDLDLFKDFDKEPYNPKRGREMLAKLVDDNLKQIKGDKPKRRDRLWSTGYNEAIAFELKLNGQPIAIRGKGDAVHDRIAFKSVKAERVLNGIKAAILETDLYDADIQRILENPGSEPSTVKPARASTGTRAPRGEGLGKAEPDNPEWMARFREKYGDAPSDDHVPNSKGTKWVSKAAFERGLQAAASRAANKGK